MSFKEPESQESKIFHFFNSAVLWLSENQIIGAVLKQKHKNEQITMLVFTHCNWVSFPTSPCDVQNLVKSLDRRRLIMSHLSGIGSLVIKHLVLLIVIILCRSHSVVSQRSCLWVLNLKLSRCFIIIVSLVSLAKFLQCRSSQETKQCY